MIKTYVVSMVAVTVSAMMPLVGAEVSELPQVRVQGVASLKVAPDEMVWNLKVENKGAELARVAEVHSEKVTELLSFLTGQEIEKKDTKTARMEFGENWGYRDRQRVKEGYYARTSVTFSSKDFEKYKPLWMGLAKLGDVSVQSVQYRLNDRDAEEQKLKVEAVQDAKKKAAVLAEALGASIAEPLLIEDNRSAPVNRVQHLEMADASASSRGAGNGAASSAPGQLKIESKVGVVFRLVPPAK